MIIAYDAKKRRFRAAPITRSSGGFVMSLTSSRIRAVNAVFDAGSFSRAARRLGMSQPAVTQQVRGLENHFGVTLFERRGSKLMPTRLMPGVRCRHDAATWDRGASARGSSSERRA
jgi:DNA-binding transcriptional ArsR family regulator